MNKLLLLCSLGLLALPASAQSDLPEISPVSSPAAPPATVPNMPMPNMPAPNMPPPGAAPAVYGTPDKVAASLEAPRTASGEFTLKLTLKNSRAAALAFSANRNSEQGCAAAPSLRVLQVGTRQVVYPSGEKRICTQEIVGQTASAGGSATFARTLNLPAGEYMVEGWFQGFAGSAGQRVKVSAQPIRITVK